MYKVHCINNVAKVGTDALGENFRLTDNVADAEDRLGVAHAGGLQRGEIDHDLLFVHGILISLIDRIWLAAMFLQILIYSLVVRKEAGISTIG